MARSRRGRGEGGIRQRKEDGLWVATIALPPIAGKRRRALAYAATKAEALLELSKLQAEHAQDPDVPSRTDKTTLGGYLQNWLAGKEIRDKTRAQYTWIVESYLAARLGGVRLSKIDVATLDAFFAALRKDNIGARTRQLCYDVLRAALKRAALGRRLPKGNPIDLVDRPRVERREIDPWSRDEAKLVLEAAKSDRFYALYVLELRLGLQFPGEVLGLRWDRDVDLEAKKLRVGGQLAERGSRAPTKTEARRRELDLPGVVVEALRAHRERLMSEGLRASPYVFPSVTGGPQDDRGFVRRSFDRVVVAAGKLKCRTCGVSAEGHAGNELTETPRKDAKGDKGTARQNGACDAFVPGVRRVRPYDMRHTFATLALQANVHIKVVSRMLGHASVVETLRTYSHFLPSQLEDANEKIGAQFGDEKPA